MLNHARNLRIERVRHVVGAIVVSAAVVMTPVAAAPASAAVEAQQQTGLVNVDVGDVNVLRRVAIGVAAGLAANLCNLQVGVIAEQVQRDGQFTCTATASGQQVEI